MSARTNRRGAVMPILRLLVWAIIAAALIKIAFFPSVQADDVDGLEPGGVYGELTVFPEKGSITNSLSLDGTVQADAASSIKATFAGQVTQFYVNDGDAVTKGDTLLILEHEEPGEDIVDVDEDGNETVSPGESVWTHEYVTAPASGTVSFTALKNQEFAIGDSLGTVQPPTYSAVVSLTPDQMYRMEKPPETATVTIKNGPAPFKCEGLAIKTPGPGTSEDSELPDADGEGDPGTSIEARCAIPSDQKVFNGLQVSLEIEAGKATDVLTLPVSAVEGRYQEGFVYAPNYEGGDPEKIAVTIGITDGEFIQIKEGISEDQELLEFVPGNSEMECNEFTGEGC
ncbi:MAG: efflux RND transporter periplasmic adaptor subunit [Ancrocorticia sp.]|uniref:efflux RND transporter periplasmic adaptor subunit n=1 Tax=Ancrocorticia sp. TaxID=2593684 RepID=UPI003F90F0B1